MTKNYKQQLTQAGVNLESALERFMRSEVLLEKILAKFPQDNSFSLLKNCLAENRLEDAFMASHTLKGICANFDMYCMTEILTPLTQKLRIHDTDGVADLMETLEYHYLNICNIIKNNQSL